EERRLRDADGAVVRLAGRPAQYQIEERLGALGRDDVGRPAPHRPEQEATHGCGGAPHCTRVRFSTWKKIVTSAPQSRPSRRTPRSSRWYGGTRMLLRSPRM